MATISKNGTTSGRPRRQIAAPVVACIIAVLAAGVLSAQTVPTGVQEYFILGWEQHIWDMMDRVQNAQGGAQFDDGMNSVITATASADNQLVFLRPLGGRHRPRASGLSCGHAAAPALDPRDR